MSKIEDFKNRVDLALRPAHNDDFVSHRTSWREALVIARDSAKVSPPDTDDKAYWEHELRAYDRAFLSYAPDAIPEDFETHRSAWREALEIAREQAAVSAPDVDDKAYWTHELAAFDRAFESIGAERKLPQLSRESLEEQLQKVPGQVLGSGMPDWPTDLTTFKERQAYQRGVAHARFLAQNTLDEEPLVATADARYREEQIRENFGSRTEFLEMTEHDDAVRKLSEIVWEFNGFSTEVAKINGIAIGHVSLRGRPDYDDAYEVVLYNSAGEKDAVSGKPLPAAVAHVGPEQDKAHFLKMVEEALKNGTPSDVLTALKGEAVSNKDTYFVRILSHERGVYVHKTTDLDEARRWAVDIEDNQGEPDVFITDQNGTRVPTRADQDAPAEASVRDAARALLDAFGGDTPAWLRKEAVALASALDREVAAAGMKMQPDATKVFSAIEKANIQLRPAGLPTYGDLVAALAEVAKKVPFCPEQDTAARLVEQVQSAGGVQSSVRARMRP